MDPLETTFSCGENSFKMAIKNGKPQSDFFSTTAAVSIGES